MGGESKQSTTQSATTSPWEPAQPAIQSILGQLNSLIPSSGISSPSQGAINQLTANGQAGNPYAGQIGNFATNLLNGGGATDQAGNISSALSTFTGQMSPYAQPGYSSLNNPALQAALRQVRTDTSNQVNGAFAAAGRDMSGMNQQTLARGIAQGEAPLILNQFNQDQATQQNAANALYGASNTTASLLGNLQQQQLANRLQGVQTANDALSANNYGPNTVLQAQSLEQSMPASALGLLAQIGIPIASLGAQSTGQSQTTKQDSGAMQFAQIAGGLGSLLTGGGNFMKYLPSDERIKEDITPVGTLYDGQTVYLYRYAGSITWHIGLLAQEVEKIIRAAVHDFGGMKAVNYREATEPSRKIAEAA